MDYDKLKKRWFLEELARKKISDEMKSSVISKGIPLFKRFGIHKVVLFGSVIDGRSLLFSGYRPAVIDDELYRLLDDFRAFRHKFRHSYAFELDWEKERLVAGKFLRTAGLLRSEVQKFLINLEQIEE